MTAVMGLHLASAVDRALITGTTLLRAPATHRETSAVSVIISPFYGQQQNCVNKG